MATALMNTFPQFSLLPAEIQLQIWESTSATLPTRQMHILDVQAPPVPPANNPTLPTAPTCTTITPFQQRHSSDRRTRSRSPHVTGHSRNNNSSNKNKNNNKRIRKSSSPPAPRRNATCLAALPTVSLAAFSTTTTGFDPSGYKFRAALRATCVDAANTVRRAEARIPAADRAMVELVHISDGSGSSVAPGSPPALPPRRQQQRRLQYDNSLDVLHLRFLDPTGGPPLSTIFQSLWSPALATALHGARRVAIDVAQIWPELPDQQHKLVQDIVFLVCTLQNSLEVLYLVDYCSRGHNVAQTLASKDSELYSRFHSYGPGRDAEKKREADVIHGNGTVWREVFDLESMGWHERHPGFVFGEMFGEVVRLQQGQWFGEGEKRATFQGVRVLVAENQIAEGVHSDHMDE